MTDDSTPDQGREARGAKTKLLGVILIFVGVLDSMLFWRGGLALSDAYLALIAIGVVLYIVGTLRAGARTP